MARSDSANTGGACRGTPAGSTVTATRLAAFDWSPMNHLSSQYCRPRDAAVGVDQLAVVRRAGHDGLPAAPQVRLGVGGVGRVVGRDAAAVGPRSGRPGRRRRASTRSCCPGPAGCRPARCCAASCSSRLSQSYQPVSTVASVLLRSRYGCRLPMQYGQPWLPAEVMIVAVSYFAGPRVGARRRGVRADPAGGQPLVHRVDLQAGDVAHAHHVDLRPGLLGARREQVARPGSCRCRRPPGGSG